MNKRSRRTFALALSVFLLTMAVPAGADGTAATDEDCTPHPPISITEEQGPQGFVVGENPATGEPIHRPGSGVVAGNGSAEDPYVIEGWCLPTSGLAEESTGEEVDALVIENTTSHVVVRDNLVLGDEQRRFGTPTVFLPFLPGVPPDARTPATPGQADGVVIDGAANVTLEDNIVEGISSTGIHADGAANFVVRDNQIDRTDDAVRILDAPAVLVDGNRITKTRAAIDVEASPGAVLSDNEVSKARSLGFRLADTPDARLVGNELKDGRGSGLLVIGDSGSATVADNRIATGTTNADDGIEVRASDDHRIENNTVTGNNNVVGWTDNLRIVEGSQNNTIVGNELDAARSNGILVRDSPDNEIRDNHVYDNGRGLRPGNAQIGIRLIDSPDNLVADNDLRPRNSGFQRGDEVGLFRSDGGTVRNNTIVGSTQIALKVQNSEDVLVEDNVVSPISFFQPTALRTKGVQDSDFRSNVMGGSDATFRSGSDGNTIANNVLKSGAGFNLAGDSDRNLVEHNAIRGDGNFGVLVVSSSDDNRILENEIRDNGDAGVRIGDASGTQVHGNNIADNGGLGVTSTDGRTVNATDNWWGCPNGPEDPDCDGVGGQVLFEPFLTEPNPDAGVVEGSS